MYLWRPITNFLLPNQAYNEENFKPKQRFYYSKLTWYNKENCLTNKSFTCLPLCTDDHILEWSSALDTSVIDNWKINNPTCTRSEISINLSFYVYIISKRNNYSSNSKKKKNVTIVKLAIKNIYPNYQHYTDIDPSVNSRPHISCL